MQLKKHLDYHIIPFVGDFVVTIYWLTGGANFNGTNQSIESETTVIGCLFLCVE